MGRLIDEDAAIKIVAYECGEFAGLAGRIEKRIKALPPAQPERTRGYWEYMPGLAALHNTIWWYTCSACGSKAINGGILTDFCPNCGADMRGENNG